MQKQDWIPNAFFNEVHTRSVHIYVFRLKREFGRN